MDKKFLKDLVERVAWTAAQAFLSVFTITNLSSVKSAGVAAAAAALAALKGIAAKRIGDPNSAATLR